MTESLIQCFKEVAEPAVVRGAEDYVIPLSKAIALARQHQAEQDELDKRHGPFDNAAALITSLNAEQPQDVVERVAKAASEYAATLPGSSRDAYLLRSHRIGFAKAAIAAMQSAHDINVASKPQATVLPSEIRDTAMSSPLKCDSASLRLGGARSPDQATVAPVPIGKYSGAHPHYKHRRIIGYLYDDVWPEMHQLPDDPLRSTVPVAVSLEAGAMAISGYDTGWKEENIKSAKACAEAWGLKWK